MLTTPELSASFISSLLLRVIVNGSVGAVLPLLVTSDIPIVNLYTPVNRTLLQLINAMSILTFLFDLSTSHYS